MANQRASHPNNGFSVEAYLLNALKLSQADYNNANTNDPMAAKSRYVKALDAFASFILRGSIPDEFKPAGKLNAAGSAEPKNNCQ